MGDRAVKEQLEALDGGLGGESSGHIIIRDHMISGDGIIAGLYVLMILAKMRVTLASLVQEVPWWPSYSLNTVIKDQAMRNIFLSEAFEGQIAAIRAQYAPHCRIISRVSGTEPVHRLMIEAEDKTVLAEAKAKIAALMHELKLSEAVSL